MTQRKPNWRRMLIVLGLIVAGAIGLVVCAVVAAGALLARQASEAPGEGAKAERGYQATEPIIVALRQYHEDHDGYPDSLDALTPDYLLDVPAAVNDWPIEYRLTDESYSLEFSYTGPGMNHCAYTPEAGWDCYGYY